MQQTPQEIVQYRWDGMISHDEAKRLLDEQQVRGAFGDQGSFIGYDYRDQQWLELSPQ
jgi:hypothetical protein